MDFATTMDALSWEFYNRFVTVLTDYGIVYLPLLVFLYQHWLDADILGKDVNQSVVALSVKRMLISVITFFFLYYLAFLPTVPLSIVNEFRTADLTPAYEDSSFNQNMTTTSNDLLSHDIEIKLPLFWAAMEIFMHSIKGGFLDALPKTAGDVRGAIATVIKNKSIKTPFVRDQYNHFYHECFLPAQDKFKFMKDRGDITTGSYFGNDANLSNYNWVGGQYYLQTEGFYKPCPIGIGNQCDKAPKTPAGFYAEINGADVSCEDLWSTNGGLRKNLIKEFKLESSNSDDWINNQLRHRLKNNSGIGIQKDQAVKNLEEGGWFSLNSLATIIKQAIAIIGAWMTEFFLEIVTTAIVAFLPFGQAIALAFFVIILPIAMILSALRVDVFIWFLMYYFGISFLTIIWAIVAFIDNNIMNILAGKEGQGAGSGIVETAAQIVAHTTLSGSLISIATTFLYYQATRKWFDIMKMIGGTGMKQAKQAMDEVGSSGGKVGDTISKKIDK
jgi:hypothetical protein